MFTTSSRVEPLGKRALIALGWGIVFLAVWAVTAEIVLTREGYRVENPLDYTKYVAFDRYLGWKPDATSGRKIPAETVWPDSSRVSRPQREKIADKSVLMLGCSHTFGLGVCDSDTFVWKLNERFPDIVFDNYAVGGYGTYQCYLREKQLLQGDKHYDLVLYCGFLDHLSRNYEWKSTMGNIQGKESYAMDPRVDLDRQGNMLFYNPVRQWWGEDRSVAICFAKRVYYTFLMNLYQAHHGQFGSTEHILFWELNLRMADQAARHGAQFGLVWLYDQSSWDYLLKQRDDIRDHYPWGRERCAWSEKPEFPCLCTGLTQEMIDTEHLPHDDSHFNGRVHSFWASKIGDWVEKLLSQPKDARGEW